MSTRTYIARVTAGLLFGIVSDATCCFARDEPKSPTTIRADEIGRSVRVLGKLGLPLRSVVSVSGVWVELTEGPAKPGSSLWFRVVEVSGKRLDQPVEFRGLDLEILGKDEKKVEPAKGEHWDLRTYETWPDYGHPWDFVKEFGHQSVAPAPADQHGSLASLSSGP